MEENSNYVPSSKSVYYLDLAYGTDRSILRSLDLKKERVWVVDSTPRRYTFKNGEFIEVAASWKKVF